MKFVQKLHESENWSDFKINSQLYSLCRHIKNIIGVYFHVKLRFTDALTNKGIVEMYDILITLFQSVRITRHRDDYNNGNLFTSLYEADTEKKKVHFRAWAV